MRHSQLCKFQRNSVRPSNQSVARVARFLTISLEYTCFLQESGETVAYMHAWERRGGEAAPLAVTSPRPHDRSARISYVFPRISDRPSSSGGQDARAP